MARISTNINTYDSMFDAAILTDFQNRLKATPPGTCPVSLQYSFLIASETQTCGKCVPCRDGIPEMARLVRLVLDCKATEKDMTQLKAMAEFVRDGSDCAIGYQAGASVLKGLELFQTEYYHHVNDHTCGKGIGQTLPCESMCPAHVNIPAYIALAAEEDYAASIAMIRKDNPFPTACALVCEHPCEKRCRRALIDAPINIRGIKKYAVDNCSARDVPTPHPLPCSGHRIAVIGAGPSGMTCAYYLGLMGHEVDIFESHAQAGGMMRYGIPEYRFPRERLQEDVDAILSVKNITLHTNTHVDAETIRIFAESYSAVYLAIGAQKSKPLSMDGSTANGVFSAVEMLGQIGDHIYPNYTKKNVVVIGGGNVAMDCARSSVRLGAEKVTVVYRRRIADMTAAEEEIHAAIAEGVEIRTLQAPVSIETDENNYCTALICQPQLIGMYKHGRPTPVTANKPQERIQADIILIAVGQDIDSEGLAQLGIETNRGRIITDEYLRTHAFANIYAGGDCQTGPTTVIKGVAAGKIAARNIDEYLGYHHTLSFDIDVPDAHPNVRTAFGRIDIEERPANERKHDFDCVELNMTHEEAKQECARCLRCDVFGCGSMEGGRKLYV